MNSQITTVDSRAEFGGLEREMDKTLEPPESDNLTTALLMKV